MRLRTLFAGLMILTATCGGLTGCSTEPAGTDVPVGKPLTSEESKEADKKVMEGMKTGGGMYKGAPGVPLKPR
jgi:hypothetical protein